MSDVVLNIVESTAELDSSVVEVILESASTPGPAGPGVPEGGADGQVLTKASATDYDTAWEDPTGGSGGGAPTDADYLVGSAHGDLSAEIVVGTTPGGELGGTWASPTVDATHSGSSHASVQAAAEATAAAALAGHEADTTNIHGIADTSALATDTEVATAVSNHSADTTSVHGIADTSAVMLEGDAAGGVLGGTYPNPSFAADMATQAELDAHLNDAADAHDASAISVLDTAGDYTATDVEGVLAEIAPQLGGGGGTVEFVASASDNTATTYSANNTWEDIRGTSITFTAVEGAKYVVVLTTHWRGASAHWLHHVLRCVVDGVTTGVSPTQVFVAKRDSNANTGLDLFATVPFFLDGLAAGSRTLDLQTSDSNTSLDRQIYSTTVVLLRLK